MHGRGATLGKAAADYVVAAGCAVAGLAVTALLVKPLAGPFFMFQFAAVVGAALRGGLGPGLVTMVLSAVGNYAMFAAPGLEAHQRNRLASFVLVSVFFAWFAARMRRALAVAEAQRRRAEAAEAETRLVGAQQERLLAVVGHDLRNPLNAITITAELFRRNGSLSEAQDTGLSRMLASARRMQAIIRELLDFALARHAGGLPVDRRMLRVGDACRAAVEEVQAAYPGRAIVMHVVGDDQASFDRARLEQLVSNLLSNALKHGDADVPVRVEVVGEPSGVRLEVTNGGPPIPERLLPSLFQPFRPGDAAGSVGLGLFIVSEIARAHGGSVHVRTGDGETRFSVAFPRTDAEPPRDLR